MPIPSPESIINIANAITAISVVVTVLCAVITTVVTIANNRAERRNREWIARYENMTPIKSE